MDSASGFDLPADICLIIFAQLPLSAVRNIAQACSVFNDVISADCTWNLRNVKFTLDRFLEGEALG